MSESQRERVERIKQKLDRVRASNLQCFGSDSHQFRLNPTISESELIDFEKTHGVTLPADYRAFLLYAGNGGAGPYYGIYPLREWDDFLGWVEREPIPNYVALPCPLCPDMSRADDWENAIDAASPFQGTISIGTQGCTYVMLLVVSGAYAGRVVYADADRQAPYMVRNGDFLEWYERWLDELLGGYKTEWFGFGIGGTENELLKILEDSDSREADRIDAAEALCRLPNLSHEGQVKVAEQLADRSGGVRAGACRAVRTFDIAGAEQTIVRLLRDDVAGVRREAVLALMNVDATRWGPEVLSCLKDSDHDVASTAFFELQRAGQLTRDQLREMLGNAAYGNLRSLAAHAMRWTKDD